MIGWTNWSEAFTQTQGIVLLIALPIIILACHLYINRGGK